MHIIPWSLVSALVEASKVVFMAHNLQSRMFHQWSYKVCIYFNLLVFEDLINMKQIKQRDKLLHSSSTHLYSVFHPIAVFFSS